MNNVQFAFFQMETIRNYYVFSWIETDIMIAYMPIGPLVDEGR